MTDHQDDTHTTPDLAAVPDSPEPSAAAVMPAELDARTQAAQDDEQAQLEAFQQQAALQYLQQRVVQLNVEVRRRDEQLDELRAELAQLRGAE